MDRTASPGANSRSQAGDDDELRRAAELRRQADWRLTMAERLARLHELCKQASALKDTARRS